MTWTDLMFWPVGLFVVAIVLGLLVVFVPVLAAAWADQQALKRRLQMIKDLDTGRYHGKVG